VTSDERSNADLLEENKELKRERTRLRAAVRAQRLRAELWRQRALKRKP
jgi:hypothetical protein